MSGLVQRSTNRKQDAQFRIQGLRDAITKARLAQDKMISPERLAKGIENMEQEIREIQAEEQLAAVEDAEYLRTLLGTKRKTAYHGELIEKIERDKDDDTALIYFCKEHPDQRIQASRWDMHVSSFLQHPKFTENNPVRRRRMQESIERELNSKREASEKKAKEAEVEKRIWLEKNGFFKVA